MNPLAAPSHDAAEFSTPPGSLRHDVSAAVADARGYLAALQSADGHWVGELQGDSILESEYILLLAFLQREHEDPARQAARYLVETQLSTGGWSMYPGGKLEISASVKAYFALKITGHDPQAEYMVRARRAVLRHGGADAVNSFTRFYLALLGQISYDHCPAVPPELVLAPRWFPVNLSAMSAWSRTIVVPLSIMWAHRPVRRLAPQHGIEELFHQPPESWGPLRCPGAPAEGLFSWASFFRMTDRALKALERWRCRPLRRRRVGQSAGAG